MRDACTCARTHARMHVCTCARVYVCTCVRVYVCTCVRGAQARSPGQEPRPGAQARSPRPRTHVERPQRAPGARHGARGTLGYPWATWKPTQAKPGAPGQEPQARSPRPGAQATSPGQEPWPGAQARSPGQEPRPGAPGHRPQAPGQEPQARSPRPGAPKHDRPLHVGGAGGTEAGTPAPREWCGRCAVCAVGLPGAGEGCGPAERGDCRVKLGQRA